MDEPAVDRATRRRIARELGYRRAAGKKGRRRAWRTPVGEERTPRYRALEAAGFEVAIPKIAIPTAAARDELDRLMRSK